ncbi:MAG: hypothetical protein U1E53_30380 [Dongiaceae bacterium]
MVLRPGSCASRSRRSPPSWRRRPGPITIDGDWCQADGQQHFSIHGVAIVTPAGRPTIGDYRRHFFSYVVPAGEPGAGGTISMRLLDENTVDLRRGPDQDPGEIWHRCTPAVSRLDARDPSQDKPARL